MEEKILDPRRAAKNILFLYLRMFIIMAISLYTSRIILNTLGVEDFGLYNIIFGIVILFSFLNTSMQGATQRFLAYGIANEENGKNIVVEKYFSICLNIHIIIAFLVVILAETIGLWIVNNYLNIPLERIFAANIAYQFAIIIFVLQILKVPYNASIIATEKMSFYAYIGVIEVLLKLLLVFFLQHIRHDKLITYSILLFLLSLGILLVYMLFCRKNIHFARYKFYWNKVMVKEVFSYSTLTMLGSSSSVIVYQGTNVILNKFFGIVINASLGIANQINEALYSFVSNFQNAFNPQIIKAYALKEYSFLNTMVELTSKISFFLLFLVVLPLILNLEQVLLLWLNYVPDYSVVICKMILIGSLIDAISSPFNIAVQATGKIKKYQLIITFVQYFYLFLAYILLWLDCGIIWVFIARILTRGLINMLVGVFFSRKLVNFPVFHYLKNTILRILIVIVLTIPIAVFFSTQTDSFVDLLFYTFALIICSFLIIYIFGFTGKERKQIFSLLKIGR